MHTVLYAHICVNFTHRYHQRRSAFTASPRALPPADESAPSALLLYSMHSAIAADVSIHAAAEKPPPIPGRGNELRSLAPAALRDTFGPIYLLESSHVWDLLRNSSKRITSVQLLLYNTSMNLSV